MRINDLLSLSPVQGLQEIERRRSAVQQRIAAIRARRESLLLTDGSEAAIAVADAEADTLHLVLERLNAAEATLQRRDTCSVSQRTPSPAIHSFRKFMSWT
ncbi:hypothetical protein M0638_20420 [Roseomonas sp. NAR14]|uniref:Uncharacterized protein n=1 Tax=Roseomonas acroporae TaxID=2937791 RepID=A0A9X1YD04_9PROT|nr:hypothetical protein [Roseomonas acroporae]MCK8786740.1 hypothetical protein [Roseomonas acroporae]